LAHTAAPLRLLPAFALLLLALAPGAASLPTARAADADAASSGDGWDGRGRHALRRTAAVLESEWHIVPSAAIAALSLEAAGAFRPSSALSLEAEAEASGRSGRSPRAAVAAPPGEAAKEPKKDEGGTACRCICGDRAVWHRALFPGNVKKEKEEECREQVCPAIMIPGLRIHAECTYAEKSMDLTAGTLCQCNCGEQVAWRNRGFYGNVIKEKEKECIEELCPMVNPVPGLRFTAQCSYDENLFAIPQPREPMKSKAAHRQLRGIVAVLIGMGALITCTLIIGTHADDDDDSYAGRHGYS